MDAWLVTAQNSALEVWFVTALAVGAVLAWGRGLEPVRRLLPRTAGTPVIGDLGRIAAPLAARWSSAVSRWDGRFLAVGWLVLFALAIGDGGLVWGWPPVVTTFLVLQQLAGPLLVPWTAALYLFKAAVPQLSSEDADERERAVQGEAYRSAHRLLLAAFAAMTGLLLFNPAIGEWVGRTAQSRDVQPIDAVLPAFLLLFMLPSVAFAWRNHRPDDDSGPAVRVPLWLSRFAIR